MKTVALTTSESNVATDIDACPPVEQAFYDSERQLRLITDSLPVAIAYYDADQYCRYANKALEQWLQRPRQSIIGLQAATLLGEKIYQVLKPHIETALSGQRVNFEVQLPNPDGKMRHVQIFYVPHLDHAETTIGLYILVIDITQHKKIEQDLSHQATHDVLTGLINRREFDRRLQHLLMRSGQNAQHALCYLDLDRFKIINDSCGHNAGDELLRQLAMLFQQQVRKHDSVARLGGDEFAILLEHCPINSALQVAESLRKAVEEFRFHWDQKIFQLGVSIGLAAVTGAMTQADEIMCAADSACYQAKESGRNQIRLYQTDDQTTVRPQGEKEWPGLIQQAFDEDRFKLFFQPIAPFKSSLPTGSHYELLLRLDQGSEGLISPAAFLPAAERFQLLTGIDRWVTNTALQWLAEHPQQVDALALCTINLSANSLLDEAFQHYLLQRLEQSRVPAGKICFEISETAVITHLVDVGRFIAALKPLGCRFALDHCGRSLASFSYLKHLAVDIVKIDGLLVKDIMDDPIDFAMVRAINEIAQLLGKQTVAEFVESEAILQKLTGLGVDYVQGFHLAHPQPLI